MEKIFENIYVNSTWGGRQSRSGTGSDLAETVSIRKSLPLLIDRLKVRSILDIPCGDFNRFSETNWGDLREYHGCDIVEKIIEDNRKKFPTVKFSVKDITKDTLPDADLILTRDCLGHLSNKNVKKAVANIKRARPRFLVATHWPGYGDKDIKDGGWRPINMDKFLDSDFELIELLDEDIKDKYLGVWRLTAK